MVTRWLAGERLLRAGTSYLAALHSQIISAPRVVVLAGIGCVALAMSSDLANTYDAPRRGGPGIAVLLCFTLAVAFVAFIVAFLRPGEGRAQPDGRAVVRMLRAVRPYLTYAILLWALLTALQAPAILASGMRRGLTQWPPTYGSDDLYYNHYNAVLVLRGENPYSGSRLLDEVRYFGALDFTPLARGRFSDPRRYPSRAEMDAVMRSYVLHPTAQPIEIDPRTMHSYPAGAFLVALPFVWAGIPSVAVGQILVLLALGYLIVLAAPAKWRLVIALLLLSAADGFRQVTGGDFEIWPLACIAGAWLSREGRWRSALLLGAACAMKQTAWIAAPFFLVWVWRTYGRDEALRRVVLALGAFVACNVPWILASPRPWLESLLLPVSLPLLPDGSGIIGLSLAGALPLAPSWVYSALELLALVSALAWYWRVARSSPFVGLVLPLVPLFFAWRSSERYFVLLPVLAVLALALALRTQQADVAAGAKIQSEVTS